MKYIHYWVAALLCFFSISVPTAFANVSAVSSDPTYEQGFSFYCDLYKFPFTSNYHYLPRAGVPGDGCYYSLPAPLTNPVIELRRGTPTNSTVLAADTVTGPAAAATLVRQTPSNIPTNAVNDEYFFAVVYDSSLGSAFTDHLTNGSPIPPEAVENQNYYILPWKWGPKPAAEFEPVIIVPDIYTTWETSTGKQVDPVFHQYQNLIDTLVQNGYVLNANLFVFPYNWQQSNVTSAAELKQFIADKKTECACGYVDLIGHGMGGTIAQQYIQGGTYAKDVDQTLFLATPFYGVPSAYLAWEGAQIRTGNGINDSLIQALLLQQAKDAGHTSAYAYIQAKPVASFKELLPPQDYTDTPPANPFMNALVASATALQQIQMKVYSAEDGLATTPIYFSTTASTNPPLWPDGEPTDTYTDLGDGMVPRSSIDIMFGIDQEFLTTHRGLPTAARSTIFTALAGRAPSATTNTAYPVSCVLFLSATQPVDIQITDPNGDRLGKNFTAPGTFEEIPNAFYSGATTTTEYGVVVNPIAGDYQVSTQGASSGTFTISATEVCGSSVVATSTSHATAGGQVVGYTLTLTPSGDELTLTLNPLDTEAPVVSIESPLDGTTYLSTDTIPVTATITDPEQSPIISTSYFLNGNTINPATPLNLATLPLGLSTLVVTATDSFGHTGSATSKFTVVRPPLSDTCGVILNTSAPSALKLVGSSKLLGTNCDLQVNSNSAQAVALSGSATIKTVKNCFVGGVKESGNPKITPDPTPCTPENDPFATKPKPTVGTCTHTNLNIAQSQTVTLNPGVYCGGITVAGSAKVTLTPGVYILKDGPFEVKGSGKVTGTGGVAMFMTGKDAGFDFAGSAQVTLVAPSAGVLAGFTLYVDPSLVGGLPLETSKLAGSASLAATGIVYTPGQELSLVGSAKVAPTTSTTVVASTIDLAGSATLNLKK